MVKKKPKQPHCRPTTVSVVDLANDRYPWDRQPGESDPAWAAFIVYRDLGTDRTVKRCVERLGKPIRYNSCAQQMSARYGWRVRVEAWDREQDRVRREVALQAERNRAIETSKDMMATAESLWRLAARGAMMWHEYLECVARKNKKALADALKAGEAPPTMKPAISPRDLEALAGTGVKLQRMLGGEPGEISEIRGTFADLVRRARQERETAEEDDDLPMQAIG